LNFKSCFIILLIILSGRIYCQDSLLWLKNFDYRKADSIALNFPKRKFKSFTDVAAPLCEKLNTEHEKFRAIFRWITNNIEYNKSASNVSDADVVVRKNKAVCMGFSGLLKEMCNSVGIGCDTISGYTKTEVRDIGKKLKKTDHAWNAVLLYNKWYLVDVTWATSKYNVVTHKFEKQFDEHYFITHPETFLMDHFPEDKKWQLVSKPISKKSFINSPIYYADFFHLECSEFSIKNGKFSIKSDKAILLSFKSKKEINEAGLMLNYDNTLLVAPIKFDTKTGLYSMEFYLEKPGNYDITLFLNKLATSEFIVKVKK
jgi:hypothetical protein